MVSFDAKAARDTDRSYLDPEIVNQRLQTIQALALRAGENALDAGCGTGLLTALMSAQVGEQGLITGVDYSQSMLDLAAARCNKLGNVELHQGSVTELPFKVGSFEVASCIQTLLYVDKIDTAIGELHRVLKPGGRIGIIETDWHGVVISNPDHQLTRTIVDAWDSTVSNPNLPPKLVPMLSAAGFSAIRVQAIPVLNSSFNASGYGASMIRYMARNAVKQNVIEQPQADMWLQQIVGETEQQGFFFCVNRFLFTAVK